MIRSMTGFGAAEGTVGSARVTVELRSVNHRFFNATIKLPAELSRWEGEVREALRKRLSRGHITMNARVDRGVAGPPIIDEERFGAYVGMLRDLKDRFGLAGDVDVATVLRMPDVMSSISEGSEGEVTAFLSLVDAAAASLAKSRRQEGERLGAYLLERLTIVEAALMRISARAHAAPANVVVRAPVDSPAREWHRGRRTATCHGDRDPGRSTGRAGRIVTVRFPRDRLPQIGGR